jgi:hypothetical protein
MKTLKRAVQQMNCQSIHQRALLEEDIFTTVLKKIIGNDIKLSNLLKYKYQRYHYYASASIDCFSTPL